MTEAMKPGEVALAEVVGVDQHQVVILPPAAVGEQGAAGAGQRCLVDKAPARPTAHARSRRPAPPGDAC